MVRNTDCYRRQHRYSVLPNYIRVGANRLLVNVTACGGYRRARGRHSIVGGQNDGSPATTTTWVGGVMTRGRRVNDRSAARASSPASLRSTLADVDSIRLSNAWSTVLVTRWPIDDELCMTVWLRGRLSATHE